MVEKKTLKNPKSKKIKKNTKLKSTQKSNNKNTTYKPILEYYEDKFITDTRLNLDQMKYCSCLLSVRNKNSKKRRNSYNPYPICYSTIKKSHNKRNDDINRKRKESGKRKIKHKPFNERINHMKLNCTMNYNFSNMDIDNLKLIAKERKIKLYKTKDGKRVDLTKKELIRKIRSYYFKNINKFNQ